MYCDLWPYALCPLDFQIQKGIVPMRKCGKCYLRSGRQGLRLGRKNIFLSQILTDLKKKSGAFPSIPTRFLCISQLNSQIMSQEASQ